MKIKLLFLMLFAFSLMTVSAQTVSKSSDVKTSVSNQVVLGQNYPNPAKGKTVINVEFSSSEAVVRVYNILGKKIEEFIVSSDKKVVTVDVSDYQEGIYLYSIEADGQKVTKRMTVRK